MNTDALKSIAGKAALVLGTHLATRYHISGETISAVTADVATVAAGVYGVYSHWGMKKVPETTESKHA